MFISAMSWHLINFLETKWCSCNVTTQILNQYLKAFCTQGHRTQAVCTQYIMLIDTLIALNRMLFRHIITLNLHN